MQIYTNLMAKFGDAILAQRQRDMRSSVTKLNSESFSEIMGEGLLVVQAYPMCYYEESIIYMTTSSHVRSSARLF